MVRPKGFHFTEGDVPDGERWDLALQHLIDGQTVIVDYVRLRLEQDGALVASGELRARTQTGVIDAMSQARHVVSVLSTRDGRFQKLAHSPEPRYEVIDDYGMGHVVAARDEDGSLAWDPLYPRDDLQ